MTLTPQILVIGFFTGLAYAVLGAGLVLIYRATRVINFAYGEMGAFGSSVLGLLVLKYRWPFPLAFACVLAIGAAVGGIVELTVVRRLFAAPRLILLVATIGVSQVMFFAQAVLPSPGLLAGRFPTPIERNLEIGSVLLRSEHFMVLAFVPACIGGLAIFLGRTPYGIAIRSTADNPDAARLAGISVKRVSTMVWVLAGALATVTTVLIAPLRGGVVGFTSVALGPSLLLRALTAALVGRLTSFPLALAGGVVVGIVESVLFANFGDPGITDVLLFLAVLVLVFLRGRPTLSEAGGAWSLAPRVRDIPERLREYVWVRHMPRLAGSAALAIALVLPSVLSSSERLFLFSRVFLFAVIALSVTVLTGWAGQLSLGQFAFVGLGALTTATLHAKGVPFAAAVAYSTAVGTLAALAIGAPALRIPGLYLAVTTLAFAVAARGWLFPRSIFFGESSVVFLPRGTFAGINFQSQRAYYYLCLLVLVLVSLAVSRLRRTGIARNIIAVRDNEPSAASFTVSPTLTKLSAFGVAGALAALAGGLLAGLWVQFGPDAFGPDESLRVVAMTIIGGLGSVPGSILGAVYVIGLPALFGGGIEVRLLTSGVGLLVLLMYLPGGLVQVVVSIRDGLLAVADRRLSRRSPVRREQAEIDPANAHVSYVNTPGNGRPAQPDAGPALAVHDVTVRFGGVRALEGVSLHAMPGESVGLIGSNGAGKSTLMNVISGFIKPQMGRVELFGEDITILEPYERARAGVGRVFQDARLFGDLTVIESVQVALEARERSELVPSLLALPPSLRAERRKRREASELIQFLGLGGFADAFISDLSTGTRRIAELSCLLALRPRVLLLDEPTAGVAQRETEAFGPLIKRIQEELKASLVVIEHDLPLVMSISDRVYCLGVGRVIAEGSPDIVRRHPDVVASYLGTDERAILRSGVGAE